MVAQPIVVLYATSLKRVLNIMWIKICHLKSENKWESSRRLDPTWQDIGVHRMAQSIYQ